MSGQVDHAIPDVLDFVPPPPPTTDEHDESRSQASSREELEADEVKLRRRLNDPKCARGAYTDMGHGDPELTHAEFRALYQLLKKADPDLGNSFMFRETVAAALGMKITTYDWHLRSLVKKGYVVTQEFRREDGKQSSSGIQFCLPGRLFASSEPWTGPRRWDKRASGVPKRNRKVR